MSIPSPSNSLIQSTASKKKFAALRKGSRNFVSSIAISLICLVAIIVGQGCISPNPVESIDLSITGFEVEFYEPPQGAWQRTTNGTFTTK